MAIAAVGALLVGLDRAFGQVLLIAASVLTGVLLAVIGQVYQTGADVFELFVGVGRAHPALDDRSRAAPPNGCCGWWSPRSRWRSTATRC